MILLWRSGRRWMLSTQNLFELISKYTLMV
jgi:hypothetical protein